MAQENSKSHLLIIDADIDNVRLLTRILENGTNEQVDVETLIDPTQAKHQLASSKVDILITDLEMPDVNGIDLLRFAKQINPCTQVIFLTGNSTSCSLLQALELGAADYLLKPVEEQVLLDLVVQAHRRECRWRNALADTWRNRRQKVLAPA